MADPVAAFGAAAGAVQVGDAALRLSRRIYIFLGELRSAREDIQRLRETLRETDELMRNIVAYIIEWNDSSRTRQERRELPASLTHTLTWFTEDLEVLRGCLPENLSYAFVDKVKFVFQKSKIEEATTRLQERKGTANLALSTLGRQNDLRVLKDLGCLKSSLGEISSSQSLAAQQQTATLAAIQTTSIASQQRLNQLQNDSESHHADMVAGFQSLAISIKEAVAVSPTYSLTTTNVPDDPDQVGRIIRAELKQVLEPFSHRINQGLDAIVESLSQSTSRSVHELASIEDRCPSPTTASSTDPPVCQSRPQSSEIVLSTVLSRSSSRFGVLKTRVTRCRARSTGLRIAPEAYFRIQVDFSPPPWLSSYGLSAIYSTGQNAFGYYDICPSIIPFRVVPMDWEVYGSFFDDNVSLLRQMLQEGRIHWRDQMDGYGYLELAMLNAAPRTCHFLLNNYALSSGVWVTMNFLDMVVSRDVTFMEDPNRLREMVRTYLLFDNYTKDLEYENWLLLALSLLESARTLGAVRSTAECLSLAKTISAGREPIWAFPWYELSAAWGLPMSQDLSRERWLLDLFLAQGCNPNQEGTLGLDRCLPLEAALELTTCCQPSRFPERERLIIQALRHQAMDGFGELAEIFFHKGSRLTPALFALWNTEYSAYGMADPDKQAAEEGLGHHWEPSTADYQAEDSGGKADPSILLIPLIRAGADVHAIITAQGDPQGTLTDLAYDLGLEKIWAAALEECGYSFDAVCAESRRRLENRRRLNGGSASGIDMSVAEVPEASTLRYRHQTRVDQE